MFIRGAAARSTETMIRTPFLPGPGLLMRPNGGAVDHLDVAIMRALIASISRSQTPALRHRTKRL